MSFEPADNHSRRLRQQREWTDRLLDHADELDRADSVLLRSVYERGMTMTELAAVIGRHPRTVRRRVARLVQRIDSPTFQHVLRHRSKWSPLERRIAELVVLRGWTQRRTAAELNVSTHRVRQMCDAIHHSAAAYAEAQRALLAATAANGTPLPGRRPHRGKIA